MESFENTVYCFYHPTVSFHITCKYFFEIFFSDEPHLSTQRLPHNMSSLLGREYSARWATETMTLPPARPSENWIRMNIPDILNLGLEVQTSGGREESFSLPCPGTCVIQVDALWWCFPCLYGDSRVIVLTLRPGKPNASSERIHHLQSIHSDDSSAHFPLVAFKMVAAPFCLVSCV